MKTLTGFLSAVLTFSAAQAGEWRVSRAIIGETGTAAVAAVKLDAHVFANSLPDLADVRVLDGAGREVPRVIEAEREYTFEERHTPRAARLKSVEQLPEGGLAVVCEIERTNAVSLTRLSVRTPLRNYEQTVTVYVPDAAGSWRQVGKTEPLFDYSRFADVKKETVELPALTNHVFKFVIGQADDKVFSSYATLTEETEGGQTVQRLFKRYSVEKRPFRIDEVTFRDTERVAVAKEHPGEPVAAQGVEVSEDAAHKSTVLTFDAGRQPAVGLTLAPAEQNFERAVTVERAAPGGWSRVAQGRVVRTTLPGLTRQETDIVFPETRAERLRVRVRNDDNPPLTFGTGSVTIRRQAYCAVFIADKGQGYRLAYGNPEVKASPVYEQGVTAYLRSGQKAAAWRLAPALEGTVTYGAAVRARQFLTRHGMLLLSVLVMAVLGLLIGRAARRMEP